MKKYMGVPHIGRLMFARLPIAAGRYHTGDPIRTGWMIGVTLCQFGRLCIWWRQE